MLLEISQLISAYEDIVLHDKTIREVANRLGVPKSTLHEYLHRYCESPELQDVLDRHYEENFINSPLAPSVRRSFSHMTKERLDGYFKR